MSWTRTTKRTVKTLSILGIIIFTATCGLLTLDAVLHYTPEPLPTPLSWKPQTQPYYLDDLPLQFFNGTIFDGVIVIGAGEYHGPCSSAGEGDLSAARLLFESISSLNPNSSPNFEDFCSTDTEYFDFTWKDVVGHRNFQKMIIIGGPYVNLGWHYYNYHKPLAICFINDSVLVKPTGNIYRGSGYWGREGVLGKEKVGPSRQVTDYAIIELYNDEGRPVLLIAGLSGLSTRMACMYLSDMLVSGRALPHAYGIVLEILWKAGDPLPVDYQIVEVVA